MSISTKTETLDWIAALFVALFGHLEPPSAPLPPISPPVVRAEPAPARPAGISCRIVRQRDGEFEQITATATSAAPIKEGSFVLLVRRGGLNTSVNRHLGTFDAAAGETVRLATLKLSGPGSVTTPVSLSVTVANTSVPCGAE